MNQERTGPESQQCGEREAQGDFSARPTMRALKIVVKKRDVIVGDADGQAQCYESASGDPPAEELAR
jgi:hypothetical protein